MTSDEQRLPPHTCYEGKRAYGQTFVTVNGRALDPRFDLRFHSPDGFEWGYGGSGPAQLALALRLLLHRLPHLAARTLRGQAGGSPLLRRSACRGITGSGSANLWASAILRHCRCCSGERLGRSPSRK